MGHCHRPQGGQFIQDLPVVQVALVRIESPRLIELGEQDLHLTGSLFRDLPAVALRDGQENKFVMS